MTRKEILEQAAIIVTQDRNATHGEPENSFAVIADLWSTYLNLTIAPHDVAVLMALLKIARLKTNPTNMDNWIDLAGYAACGAETL